ncbi:substrate-binding domain-containing protein [Bacillus marasmi]|uniref:substrate-binding domain-containing protein n=1 Tax=Bacillus marasmi TaxID=1926279 RepID=UPI0011C961DE|nr:substrate-binding domain-containing protein [Bacillus marasmi]
MKLRFLQLTSIAFLLMFVLFGCGTTDDTKKESNEGMKTEEKAEPKDMILATTTSTQDSGLLDALLPVFEEDANVNVKTIAVGTGQALEMGTKGEADALLTHAPKSEQALVDSGDAINYKRVMYNDFIVVGPKNDPAGVKGLDTLAAFKKIFDSKAIFISRGDDSGTHKKELEIWKAAGVDPAALDSYVSAGQGMGPTLQIGAEKGGYVLTDRATFLAQQKNLGDTVIIVEGDKDLLNIYHVMQVNPEKHDKVNSDSAEAFVEFMVSEKAQKIIAEFGVKEYGEPLFFKYTE